MEQLRVDIWDLIFKTGPQTREQISKTLDVDLATIASVVEHEWFEIKESNVSIATSQLPRHAQGFIG